VSDLVVMVFLCVFDLVFSPELLNGGAFGGEVGDTVLGATIGPVLRGRKELVLLAVAVLINQVLPGLGVRPPAPGDVGVAGGKADGVACSETHPESQGCEKRD